MKKNILITLTFVVLSSVAMAQNSSKPTIIDYTKHKFESGSQIKLSEIAESINYIRVADNVLLGDLMFSYTMPVNDKYFIIFSNGLVHRYDNSGKYINRVYSSGRGPKEAIVSTKPILNRTKGNVTVLCNTGEYKVFRLDGQLVETYSAKRNSSVDIFPIGYLDNYEIITTTNNSPRTTPQSCNPYNKYLLEVKDIQTKKEVYRYPNPYSDFRYKVVSNRFGVDFYHAFCGKVLNKYWFNFKNMDTIYTTSNFTTITPAFVLKSMEPRYDFKSWFMGNNGAMDKGKLGHSSIENISLSDRFVFTLFGTSQYLSGYYDTKTRTAKLFEKIIKNDIDGVADVSMIKLMRHGEIYNNKIYVLIDALDIIDSGKGSKFPGLTESSNPILMVINLKK